MSWERERESAVGVAPSGEKEEESAPSPHHSQYSLRRLLKVAVPRGLAVVLRFLDAAQLGAAIDAAEREGHEREKERQRFRFNRPLAQSSKK